MAPRKKTASATKKSAVSKTPAKAKSGSEDTKKLGDYKQEKPVQLSLFELLLPAEKALSNTVELYDFIPKYHWGKVERVDGTFLRSLDREFECRGRRYHVNIQPASLKDKNGEE